MVFDSLWLIFISIVFTVELCRTSGPNSKIASRGAECIRRCRLPEL